MAGQQSGLAAGAQAGAAFGPWGALIGGAAGAVTDLAGQAMAGPNQAQASTDSRQAFDGSGWTVATGGSKSTGGKSGGLSQTGATNVPATPSGAAPSFASVMPSSGSLDMTTLAWLALGGLLIWAIA